jgi:purine-nucleoside phosphorylase
MKLSRCWNNIVKIEKGTMQENQLKQRTNSALTFIRSKIDTAPKAAIILGSGLGRFAENIQNPIKISTFDIPYYPKSTVAGHEGCWIAGKLADFPVLIIQGRTHYYEGYSLQQITFPIHLIAGLGIKYLILTTACGGLDTRFKPGDFMIIKDHINMSFKNPLVGKPDELLGPRFPDLSQAYDPELHKLANSVAKKLGFNIYEGIFGWLCGPNYETLAEIKMMKILGAQAVSMSTVPEVIVANQRQLHVFGLSIITNIASKVLAEELTHQSVTHNASKVFQKLDRFLTHMIQGIALIENDHTRK